MKSIGIIGSNLVYKRYLLALSYQSNSTISKNTDGQNILEEISNLYNSNELGENILFKMEQFGLEDSSE